MQNARHAVTNSSQFPAPARGWAGVAAWHWLLPLWWLVAFLLPAQGQEPTNVEAAVMEKARQHLRSGTPKGLSPLHAPVVKLVTREDRRRVVEFTVEFECAEPRYDVRDLQVDGRPLPAAVAEQLRNAGVTTRYLARRWGRGDATGPVSGSFSVLADGNFGVIPPFEDGLMGYLRAEQKDLPVQGDAAFAVAQKAAEAAAAAQAQASRNAFLSKAANVGGNLATLVKGNLPLLTGGLPLPGINPPTNDPAPATNAVLAATNVLVPPPPPAPAPAPVAAPPVAEPAKEPATAPAVSDKAGPAKSAKSGGEWLTPKEAAELLKISETEVMEAIAKGELKAKKLGPVWRISAKDLE